MTTEAIEYTRQDSIIVEYCNLTDDEKIAFGTIRLGNTYSVNTKGLYEPTRYTKFLKTLNKRLPEGLLDDVDLVLVEVDYCVVI